MSAISYQDQTFSLEDGETVLDGLLRQEQDLSYSCRAGVCQSCVMVCEEGEIPLVAQKGLKESQKAMNYFLACQCKPEGALKVASVDQEKLVSPGRVISKDWLNPHVMRLRIEVDFDFRAGQFVTLWKDSSIGRSYSIASMPADGFIECHIKVIEGGAFSQWAKDELKEGQTIGVQGPMGLCFYQGNGEEHLLLSAIGTGLAPILGILLEALSKGHSGKIDLFVGAKQIEGFYMLDSLRQLAKQYDNLTLHLVSQNGERDDIRQADLYSYVKEVCPSTKDVQAYLCGAESFVKKMKRQIFLAGAAMSDIYSDGFIAS